MQLSNRLSKTISVNVMVSCVKTFTNGFVPWEAGVRRRKKEELYQSLKMHARFPVLEEAES